MIVSPAVEAFLEEEDGSPWWVTELCDEEDDEELDDAEGRWGPALLLWWP